jgi:hypothetical protein
MRAYGRVAAGVATLAAVFAMPGVATAATVLNSGQWVNPYGRQPATSDYTVTTTRPYWSAVVMRPGYIFGDGNVVPQYQVQLLDGANGPLAASTLDWYWPNFVAVDGNVRPPQSYTARVTKIQDDDTNEQYGLTFVDGGTVAPIGTSTIQAPPSGQRNDVYLRDVWVPAGQSVTVTVGLTGVTCPDAIGTLYLHAYLLASDPANPSSPVQGAQSALAQSAGVFQNGADCAVRINKVTTRAAWYGLLIFAPGAATMSVTVSEIPWPPLLPPRHTATATPAHNNTVTTARRR